MIVLCGGPAQREDGIWIGQTVTKQIGKYLTKSMSEKFPVQINVRLNFDAGHAVDQFFVVLMEGELHIRNRKRNLLSTAG
jgi:hypothetical protein